MSFLELKIPPLLLTLLFAAAALGLAQWLSLPLVSPLLANTLAIILVLTGLCVLGISALQFRLVKTTLNPMKPDASTLVTSGIYRYTRNPMYLGMFFLLAGCIAYCNSLLSLLLLPAFVLYMTRFQIVPEERFLLAKFGASYSAFLLQTRRWF